MILDALRTALGPGVPIIGGGAAPRDPSTEADGASSREFAGDVLTGDALAILLFAGPLAFSFGVETGWRGVGPRATITRTSDAGVLEIDGRPALEFYERYVGDGPAADRQPAGGLRGAGLGPLLPADAGGVRPRARVDRRSSAPSPRARPSSSRWRAPTRSSKARGPRSPMPWPRFPDGRPARRRPPLLVRDAQVPAGDARRPRDRARARGPRAGRCRSAGSTAWARSRRWRRPTGRGSTTRRWSRSCSGPHRRTRSGRLDDRACPPRARPTSWRRRTSGSPAASSASRPTSGGSRSSRTRTRRSRRVCSPSSRRSARDRSGCCSTCCRSGSSTGWRPARR